MKAIIQTEYGSPDILKFKEIDKPVVKDDEVLVQVRAAGLHAGDWLMMRGMPYIMRPGIGLRKPKNNGVGTDVAGIVDAIGTNVTRFQLDDEVFGTCNGACAEFACAGEDKLAIKPANLTFEQAATVPTSAFTALQALRDAGEVASGQKVLIIGASGGVGTFAVQIAKSYGADVTGVCSTRNVEMVLSIGADHVIDYTQEDFTKHDERYDLILDMAGSRPLSDLRRVLIPKGILVLVGGRGGPWLMGMGRTIRALLLSPFVSQQLRFFVSMGNPEDLAVLTELLESGQVTPVIDRTYPLNDTAQAIGYIEQGHAQGKVVIRM